MNLNSKWGKTMLAKFGSEEAVVAEMARRQAISRENYKGNGGFGALDAERRIEIARMGAKASAEKRRKPKQ